MQSALYVGWVRHRRLMPRPHAFRYRLFLLWLDLDELDRVFAGRWLWSTRRPNLAWWRRADHFGDPARPLAEVVRDEVERQSGQRPAGPIRLLSHPRYFGFGFNPVSLFYCYAADGYALEAIVAEVTNTPWKERHVYVLPMSQNLGSADKPAFRQAKAFHVSPFLPMNLEYVWRLTRPGANLVMHMEDHAGDDKVFDATMNLERRPITASSLAWALLHFPWMTGQVVFAIYWQALRLWLKGTPIFDHPSAATAQRERSA
jgi:uncharacterized protein